MVIKSIYHKLKYSILYSSLFLYLNFKLKKIASRYLKSKKEQKRSFFNRLLNGMYI